MGAKEIKSKITNRNVYVKYNPTLIDYIDLKFNQPFKTLLKIEIVRSKFILVWNELLRTTGAVTLQDGKFYYILQSLLLNLGSSINEKLNTIKLSIEEPFIECDINDINNENMRMIESYRKLLIFAREHEKQIFELNDEININVIEVEDITRNPDKILSRENVPAIKGISIKTKMNQNLMRLKNGQLTIGSIKNTIEDIKRSLPDFINKFYYGEEMRKIEKIILEAKSKSITTPPKLVYKFINQPKLLSYDDYHDVIDKDIKSEEEAKDILMAYYQQKDINKIPILYPSSIEPMITNVIPTIISSPIRDKYRSITESREAFSHRNLPLSRTVEPRSGYLKREKIPDYNRTLTEPRTDIRREFEEIERRRNSDQKIYERKERDLDNLNNRNLTERINDVKNEVDREIAEVERRVNKSNIINSNNLINDNIQEKDINIDKDISKNFTNGGKIKKEISDKEDYEIKKDETLRKVRKMRKIKKHNIHKQEDKENIDINKPSEEIIISTTKASREEKEILPSSTSLKKENIKITNLNDNSIKNSKEIVSIDNEDYRAEEKLNETNNTLDIYNFYLRDIYVNPANTKTVIKSMLEIPEENLIVTGNDVGEIRIFEFNKNIFLNKNKINDNENNGENIKSSLKLIHEIKVFDSSIKSMVFLPSREFASYLGDKNINIKFAENLKLKYYLVCSCLDGHMSLIDLRNFNEEKIYPINNNNINANKNEIFKDRQIKNLTNINIIEKETTLKENINEDDLKNQSNENRILNIIEGQNKGDDLKENIIIESSNNESNVNEKKETKIINSNLEEDINFIASDPIPDSSFSHLMKLNTINLPIYSMVFIPNRKTVLFSQGTDIFEFNNFSSNKGKINEDNKSKIRILIPEAHKDEINLLYFIKEKNILISCSKDNRILLWDFSDPNKIDNYISIGELAGSISRIYSICSGYIEGVWHIASLSKEGIVNFWNLENKEKSKTINFPFNIKSIQFFGYENIFLIIKKNNGFILFDAFDDQFKEFCNLDKINKEIINNIKDQKDIKINKKNLQNISQKLTIENIDQENMKDFKLNIHPKKKIENMEFEKLNLLSLRLMSKYTCGILVGNYIQNIENENDIYYAIFANKLGNLDVWANYEENEI